MNSSQNSTLSFSPSRPLRWGFAALIAATLVLSAVQLYSLQAHRLQLEPQFWLAAGLMACAFSLACLAVWGVSHPRAQPRTESAEDEAMNSMFDPRDHEAASLNNPLTRSLSHPLGGSSSSSPLMSVLAQEPPAAPAVAAVPVPAPTQVDFDLSAAASALAADPSRTLVHSKVVFHAAEAAQRGGEVVSRVVSNMEDIASSSRKINEILSTIDSIAMQTNILALNAAVQSARARQEGRGSDDVAGEVRTLAQRAASAAKEIKTLIHASVEKVESGDRLMRDASATMDAMVSSVQSVTELVGQISGADGANGLALAQVDVSVQRLDHLTQQHLGLVEQSTTAAESLRMQAERLQKVVGAFRLLQQTQEAAWEAHTVIHSVRASARADTRPGSLDKHGPPSGWTNF